MWYEHSSYVLPCAAVKYIDFNGFKSLWKMFGYCIHFRMNICLEFQLAVHSHLNVVTVLHLHLNGIDQVGPLVFGDNSLRGELRF